MRLNSSLRVLATPLKLIPCSFDRKDDAADKSIPVTMIPDPGDQLREMPQTSTPLSSAPEDGNSWGFVITRTCVGVSKLSLRCHSSQVFGLTTSPLILGDFL